MGNAIFVWTASGLTAEILHGCVLGGSPSFVICPTQGLFEWQNLDTSPHRAVGAGFDTGVLAPGASSAPVLVLGAGFHPFTDVITSSSAFGGVIEILGCSGVCGDPHFYGLDGVHYDFQGTPGQTFALISDPSLEINSAFIRSEHGTTVLGSTCVRTCGHSVVLHPESPVFVDGTELDLQQKNFTSSTLMVFRFDQNHTVVTIPGRWILGFTSVGDRIDVVYVRPLYTYANNTHGVLGHTMSGKSVPKEKCNIFTEGSCEVEGRFQDYEVMGGLCDSNWKHSFFNPEECH